MFKLVLVSLFWVQAFARPSTDFPIESHVVGGTPAKEGGFPYIVSLREAHSKEQFCGGTLISDRYVLTAAHCIEDEYPENVIVGVGSVNLTLQKFYKVDKIISHPRTNVTPRYHDIALLRLSSSVPLGGNVKTIQPFSKNDTLEGKMVTAMGWGYIGDSGSPLVYKAADGKTYVAGIVSWGIPCAKGYPDVFTRVSYYMKWIKENMK